MDSLLKALSDITSFSVFAYSFLLFIQIIGLTAAFFSRGKNKNNILDYRKYTCPENAMPLTLIVPVYNKENEIINSIEDFIDLDYEQKEIVIVNDGSNDKTHNTIIEHYGLNEIEYSIKHSIKTKNIQGVYYNSKYPNLIYVNKRRGGISDAINCGINVSQSPLYIVMPIGARLEKNCLSRLAVDFLKKSNTLISSGTYMFFNKITVNEESQNKISLSVSSCFRVIASIRNYILSRFNKFTYAYFDSDTGPFCIYNKNAVIECGGYNTELSGPFYDLILRLQEFSNKNNRKYTLSLHQEVVCLLNIATPKTNILTWYKTWQHGIITSVIKNKKMLFNPKHKTTAFLALPYNLFYNIIYVVLNFLMYLSMPLLVVFGSIKPELFLLFIALSFLLNSIISIGTVIIKQYSYELDPGLCAKLFFCCIIENLGFRQLVCLVRVWAILRHKAYAKKKRIMYK